MTWNGNLYSKKFLFVYKGKDICLNIRKCAVVEGDELSNQFLHLIV